MGGAEEGGGIDEPGEEPQSHADDAGPEIGIREQEHQRDKRDHERQPSARCAQR